MGEINISGAAPSGRNSGSSRPVSKKTIHDWQSIMNKIDALSRNVANESRAMKGLTVEKSAENIAAQPEAANREEAESSLDHKPVALSRAKNPPVSLEGIPADKLNKTNTQDTGKSFEGKEFTAILDNENEMTSGKKYNLKNSDLQSENTFFWDGSYRSRKFNVDDLNWSILNRRNNKWNEKITFIDKTVNGVEVQNKNGEVIAKFEKGKFFVKDKEVSMEKFQRYTSRRGDTMTVNYNPVISKIEHKNSIAGIKIEKEKMTPPDLSEQLLEASRKAQELFYLQQNATTKRIPAEVISKIEDISARLNCKPEDLMAVINAESSFNPKARNKRSGATGLIQFMPRTARGLGTSTEELRNMSTLEQLDYVEKYLQSIKRSVFSKNHKLTGAELYALIYLPKNAAKEELAHKGTKYYSHNRGLDKDNDGIISKDDLAAVIRSKYINVEIV